MQALTDTTNDNNNINGLQNIIHNKDTFIDNLKAQHQLKLANKDLVITNRDLVIANKDLIIDTNKELLQAKLEALQFKIQYMELLLKNK